MVPDENTSLVLHGKALAAGYARPLKLLVPTWEKKEIGQSSPYPYSRNTITVTLNTNVPLTSDCPTPVSVEINQLLDYSIKNREGALSKSPAIHRCTGSCCSSGLTFPRPWSEQTGLDFSAQTVANAAWKYPVGTCEMMIVGEIKLTFLNFHTKAGRDYVKLFDCPHADASEAMCTERKSFY